MFSPDLPIETQRLTLRAYAPDDYDALHAIVSRADVNRFLYTEPRGPDETLDLLQRKMGNTELLDEDDSISAAVCLRETGELVGDTMLHWVSRAFTGSSAAWRRGMPPPPGCSRSSACAARRS